MSGVRQIPRPLQLQATSRRFLLLLLLVVLVFSLLLLRGVIALRSMQSGGLQDPIRVGFSGVGCVVVVVVVAISLAVVVLIVVEWSGNALCVRARVGCGECSSSSSSSVLGGGIREVIGMNLRRRPRRHFLSLLPTRA